MERTLEELLRGGALHDLPQVHHRDALAEIPDGREVDAKNLPGVWFARRIDIARWWLSHYGHLPALAS